MWGQKERMVEDSFGIAYWRDGSFHPISEQVFRKYTTSDLELEIAALLQRAPHPHIVQIYHVADDHYDMEMLTCTGSNIWLPGWIAQMTAAKSWLQRHGIAYIDWSLNNTGVDTGGVVKLFDFDASALQGRPIPECERYRAALVAGVRGLYTIDDWAFSTCVQQPPQGPCDPAAHATPSSGH